MRKIVKKIELELELFEGIQDEEKGIFQGGPKVPEISDSLIIEVHDDKSYNEKIDDFLENGKTTIHFAGDKASLAEIGKLFIALSEYETKDPDFHIHLDDLLNSKEEEKYNIIIHLL